MGLKRLTTVANGRVIAQPTNTAISQKLKFTVDDMAQPETMARQLNEIVEHVQDAHSAISGNPSTSGTIFPNQSMTAGATTTIRHLLGKPFAGYQCIRAQGAAFSAFEPSLPVAIASSTNATPIVVTTAAAHNYTTGQRATIAGHTVNLAANGTWLITVTGATTFRLEGSVGVGVGGATGTATLADYNTSDVLILRSNNTGKFDLWIY